MFKFLYHYSSLRNFYLLSKKVTPYILGLFVISISYGLFGALALAPADYQQGDSFRIMYVHVPSAWMSLLIYVTMSLSGISVLIWRLKLAEITLELPLL